MSEAGNGESGGAGAARPAEQTTTPARDAQLLERTVFEVKRIIVGQDRLVERVLVGLLAVPLPGGGVEPRLADHFPVAVHGLGHVGDTVVVLVDVGDEAVVGHHRDRVVHTVVVQVVVGLGGVLLALDGDLDVAVARTLVLDVHVATPQPPVSSGQ